MLLSARCFAKYFIDSCLFNFHTTPRGRYDYFYFIAKMKLGKIK